jgi:hypothetical protein
VTNPARRLLRALAAAVIVFASAPAFAGDAETAYLHSLAGDWTGTGRFTGEMAGAVACRLVFKPSGARLNFNGRCNMSGGGDSQSFSGSIKYSDERKRYESSSSGITVVGKKNGSTLTFVTEQKTIQGDINSTMSISPRAVKVVFKLANKSGSSEGSISYKKS